MKKVLSLAMAVVLTATLATGCKSSSSAKSANSAGSAQQMVTVKFVEPGDQPKDYTEVATKINEKLKEDGTGIQLERQYIPWDSWSQKINLMLSTGEEFDLFPVMADVTPFSSYYAKGALASLNDAINNYGSNLKKYISDNSFKAAEVDGKIVTIPAIWVELASEGEFDIRLDLLNQNNLSVPTTIDELFNDVKIVQKNWKGNKKLYLNFVPSYDPISLHTTVFERTYDSFPFTILDGFFYVDQKGNVKPWIETSEFKQDCAYMRKAYNMGLINPDVLSYTSDKSNNDVNNGNWFVMFGTGGSLSGLQKSNSSATNKDVETVFFDTDKGYLRPLSFKNSVSVSSTSTHVNESVKFMNWLYASQDNYDLYFYGIKGVHWKADGTKGITKILDANNNNTVDYSDSDWMSGNMQFERVDNVNSFIANNEVLYTKNTKAVDSISSGFTFDSSKVQAQYANIQTEAKACITPIVMGVQDYDKAFPAALKRMKAAGLDAVFSEFETQYKAFLTKNNRP